jgi:hypothetical protein
MRNAEQYPGRSALEMLARSPYRSIAAEIDAAIAGKAGVEPERPGQPLMMAGQQHYEHDHRRAEGHAHDDHPGVGQANQV